MSQSRCLSDAGCTIWSDQLRDMISIRKSGGDAYPQTENHSSVLFLQQLLGGMQRTRFQVIPVFHVAVENDLLNGIFFRGINAETILKLLHRVESLVLGKCFWQKGELLDAVQPESLYLSAFLPLLIHTICLATP